MKYEEINKVESQRNSRRNDRGKKKKISDSVLKLKDFHISREPSAAFEDEKWSHERKKHSDTLGQNKLGSNCLLKAFNKALNPTGC